MYFVGIVCCILSLVASTMQKEPDKCQRLASPLTRPPAGCRWDQAEDVNNGCPKHELICSDPNADITCFAPKIRGPCESNIGRYYFNAITGVCLPFFYGGCGGNANRFADRKQCQDQCNKYLLEESSTDTNRLKGGETRCDSVKCRPGFSCQVMRSRRAEVARCVPHANRVALERCSQTVLPGSCTRRFIRYYYDRENGECRRFEYSGCNGNANNFDSKEECEHICDNVLPCPTVRLAPLPAGCRYEQAVGTDFCNTPVQVCTNDKDNSSALNCPPQTLQTPRDGCLVQDSKDAKGCPISVLACFSGACAGNPCNNEHSQCGRCIIGEGRPNSYRCERDAVCEQNEKDILCLSLSCDKPKECQVKDGFPQCLPIAGVTTVSQGVQESKESKEDHGDNGVKGVSTIGTDPTVECNLRPEKGPCSEVVQLWYYDVISQNCRQFEYGGCEGNGNRFATEQVCRQSCISNTINSECAPPTRLDESAGCRNELTTDGKGCSVYRLHCEQRPTTITAQDACSVHNCTACQQCVPRRDPCVGDHCVAYECTGGCGECETCTSNGKCLSTKVICSPSSRDFDPCAGQSCPRMPTAFCQPDACNCRKPLWVLPNDRVIAYGEC